MSVLTEVRRLLPMADILYVADQARMPYGTRNLEDVRTASLEIADWLVERGSDPVVVACNTASAAALAQIRARHPSVDVVGMEPALKPATRLTDSATIGVFATAATFQSQLFDSVIARFAVGTKVITMACPEWVETVENGHVEGRRVERLVESKVAPVVDGGADVLVLACTHFSFLRPVIERSTGLQVIDPALPVARRVESLVSGDSNGHTTALVTSGDVKRFRRLVGRLTDLTAEFDVYRS